MKFIFGEERRGDYVWPQSSRIASFLKSINFRIKYKFLNKLETLWVGHCPTTSALLLPSSHIFFVLLSLQDKCSCLYFLSFVFLANACLSIFPQLIFQDSVQLSVRLCNGTFCIILPLIVFKRFFLPLCLPHC